MTPADVKELLGLADNCTAQINDLGQGNFRVNIFEKIMEEGSVVQKNRIIRSAYITFENGVYVDKTIKAKESGNIFK
jgi:hypothetical protein